MPRRTCLAAAATAAIAATALGAIPAAAIGAKDWIAGSLRVSPSDFTMGQLIALKGAVANDDAARATGILMAAGWYPGVRAYPPAD